MGNTIDLTNWSPSDRKMMRDKCQGSTPIVGDDDIYDKSDAFS